MNDQARRASALQVTLAYFGLMDIAGAVMWVLKEVLGLEGRCLIAPVDERRGRFLLDKIMQGGNFGNGMMADGGCEMDKDSWLIRFARWTPRWMLYVALALAVLATISIWVMLFMSSHK